MGLPCPRIHMCQNFHENLITLSRDISQIVEKCPISQCRRILQKIPGSGSGRGRLQNLTSSSLCTDTSVVKFREDPFSSFYIKLLTDRQTDRQTNAGRYITSLADVKIQDLFVVIVLRCNYLVHMNDLSPYLCHVL